MHLLVLAQKPETDATSGLIFGKALEVLHTAGVPFSIAFPDAVEGRPWDINRDLPISGRSPVNPSLGERMQVFGEEAFLRGVSVALGHYFDYLHVGRVQEVPLTLKYRKVVRVRDAFRTEATVARELRRRTRRAQSRGEEVSPQEITQRFQTTTARNTLPYLWVQSKSTQQHFALYFQQSVVEEAVAGPFDTYGFSLKGSTVPLL